jgi:hypothetical protein
MNDELFDKQQIPTGSTLVEDINLVLDTSMQILYIEITDVSNCFSWCAEVGCGYL